LSAARVLGLAVAVAISTSLMTTIDDGNLTKDTGLSVALVVGAAIVGGGWWLARRTPVTTTERR
jgi:hypothetical protein